MRLVGVMMLSTRTGLTAPMSGQVTSTARRTFG